MNADITDLQRISLQPGDHLVVRVKGRLSTQQAYLIRARVTAWAGDAFPVLVLDDDASLEVVAADDGQEIVR